VVFLPIELKLSKGGSNMLHFATYLLHFRYVSATYLLRFLLHIGYMSAIKRPGQPLSGIRE